MVSLLGSFKQSLYKGLFAKLPSKNGYMKPPSAGWILPGDTDTLTYMHTCICKHAQRHYQGIGAYQACILVHRHAQKDSDDQRTYLYTNTHMHNRIIRRQMFRYTYKFMYT